MKTSLSVLAIMLLSVFGLAAMAQEATIPAASLSRSGRAAQGADGGWGVPSVPGNILFYGGDITPSDFNADGFCNGNTVLVADCYAYMAVTIPAGLKVSTSAVFFNNLVTTSFKVGETYFDPATGTYDVYTGMSDGSLGKEIAYGSGAQTAVATGRIAFGYPEYTTTVKFAKALTLEPGTTYWFNESPQCTNGGNNFCYSQFFASNTTQETNGVNASAQPAGQIYFYDSFLGGPTNLCELGLNSQQCARGSFGLLK